MKCNFHNYNIRIRWQMSKSTNVSYSVLRQLLSCQRYKNVKFCTFKKEFMVTKCNFRSFMLTFTNVCHTFLLQLLPFLRYKHFKFFYLQKVNQDHGVQFRHYTIRWKMSKSTNVFHIFLRQLLPFQIYQNCQFFIFKRQVKITV